MRIAGNIVGAILVLLGLLWVLQGSNVLGGSMMSGDNKWAVIGVIVLLAGIAVAWWTNRRR